MCDQYYSRAHNQKAVARFGNGDFSIEDKVRAVRLSDHNDTDIPIVLD